MSVSAATVTSPPSRPFAVVLRDLIALTKPRINLMVIITAAGGMWLAPGEIQPWVAITMLLTTAAVVGAANSFNCWLERDLDRLMARTQRRPLPDGRLDPKFALGLGAILGLISIPTLTLVVNPLTGALGGLALFSYVAIYTPLKTRSPTALHVGAIPGALPPLMGWTAVTGQLDVAGLTLFAVLFFWQIPHFVAISIYRRKDYEAAGMKVLPSVRGNHVAKLHGMLHAGFLIICSLLLYAFNVAGVFYLVTAIALGAMYFGYGIVGFSRTEEVEENAWARKWFFLSLIYLVVLFAVLMLDVA